MPFTIVRNDITKMQVDVIVNAANNTLLGGSGVDGAIHRAAGDKLLAKCKKIGRCETGDVKITKGYNLSCKYIFHTVGPVWHGGRYREKELLTSCYRKSLLLAKRRRCKSIAFPLISAGAYGYPRALAIDTAIAVFKEFLEKNSMQIYLVLFDVKTMHTASEKFQEIKQYIDDHYSTQQEQTYGRNSWLADDFSPCTLPVPPQESHAGTTPVRFKKPYSAAEGDSSEAPITASLAAKEKSAAPAANMSIASYIAKHEESFSQALLRLIDEKGLTDTETYKKANVDRKLFSKIRSQKQYKPKKQTAIAFAIALELNLEETQEFLATAGYILSDSLIFDLIVRYFIENRNYDIDEINDALHEYQQTLIFA